MPHINIVERQFAAFLRKPLSVRKAMTVIVTATLASVVIGGVLIRLVDSEEFPDVGTGLWWALQTVTTVGYGDVTPENGIGRLVGAVVMLEAIAFVAIVTAAITSSFVERAHRERTRPSEVDEQISAKHLAAQLSEITAQLNRIERALQQGGSAEDAAHPGALR
jgi:voltage-gated potassium channel Kch